jgi:GT2 family glycosyltransferase
MIDIGLVQKQAISFHFTPNQKRASIIIVNYNGWPYLTRCLNALLVNFNRDDEIILVDNGSTDGSLEEVSQNFPTVQLLRSGCNLGFSQGCNLGAQRATGQYLIFLNPDTVVVPGWLEALISALEQQPGVGLATPKILLLNDPEVINTCGNEIHFTGLTLCRGTGCEHSRFNQPAEVNAISGAAFIIRRDLFESLAGFDPAFFMYMEDTDLSWRVQLAGYRCLYVPEAIVYHDYKLRFGPQKTFYQERNRYLMLLKILNWPTLFLLLPALLVAEGLTWGFVLSRERQYFSNKLRAYLWIITHWKQVLERRRQTQTFRQVSDYELIAACTSRLAYEQTGRDFLAQLAHFVLDPLFFYLQSLTLTLMRWRLS